MSYGMTDINYPRYPCLWGKELEFPVPQVVRAISCFFTIENRTKPLPSLNLIEKGNIVQENMEMSIHSYAYLSKI